MIEVKISKRDLIDHDFSADFVLEELTNAGIPVSLVKGHGAYKFYVPEGVLIQCEDITTNHMVFRWEESKFTIQGGSL
jgi:hypothetical protein